MIVSMTGFGHATIDNTLVHGEASIRSLNNRFLDVQLKAPRNTTFLEPEIRTLVMAKVRRGRIDVVLTWEPRVPDPDLVRLSPGVVAGLVARAGELKERHGLTGELSVSDVVRFPGAVEVATEEEIEAVREGVLALVDRALEAMIEMRRSEGGRLQETLVELLNNIEASATRIESLDDSSRPDRIAQLRTRVAELLEVRDDGRAYAEVAKIAEKADIAEELARLRGHVTASREALAGSEASGKRLDFLAQELAREANTIASKSGSLAVVHAAVALKTEIERLREQVQNVE